MGRSFTPTALKVLRGNPGKRVLPIEPQPDRSMLPQPPEYLSADAVAEWRRVAAELYRLGLLTSVDVNTFAAYCLAFARWVKAERALADVAAKDDTLTGGLIVKTKTGHLMQHPLIGVANMAARDMMKHANEFGLTPVARTRIASNRLEKPPGKFGGLLAS